MVFCRESILHEVDHLGSPATNALLPNCGELKRSIQLSVTATGRLLCPPCLCDRVSLLLPKASSVTDCPLRSRCSSRRRRVEMGAFRCAGQYLSTYLGVLGVSAVQPGREVEDITGSSQHNGPLLRAGWISVTSCRSGNEHIVELITVFFHLSW